MDAAKAKMFKEMESSYFLLLSVEPDSCFPPVFTLKILCSMLSAYGNNCQLWYDKSLLLWILTWTSDYELHYWRECELWCGSENQPDPSLWAKHYSAFSALGLGWVTSWPTVIAVRCLQNFSWTKCEYVMNEEVYITTNIFVQTTYIYVCVCVSRVCKKIINLTH